MDKRKIDRILNGLPVLAQKWVKTGEGQWTTISVNLFKIGKDHVLGVNFHVAGDRPVSFMEEYSDFHIHPKTGYSRPLIGVMNSLKEEHRKEFTEWLYEQMKEHLAV